MGKERANPFWRRLGRLAAARARASHPKPVDAWAAWDLQHRCRCGLGSTHAHGDVVYGAEQPPPGLVEPEPPPRTEEHDDVADEEDEEGTPP